MVDIRGVQGLGAESLPAASHGLLPNLKKNYFLPFDTNRKKMSSVLCRPAANCFFLSYASPAPATCFLPCETNRKKRLSVFCRPAANFFFNIRLASALPPHVTSNCVKTATLGWVGAPNERTTFGIHDAVVGFVDRCLSRIRALAASSQHPPECF